MSTEENVMPGEVRRAAGSRAALAAERVAARYAKAPSYSEMQAAEARTAVRAAEIATQVALDAQATAQVALAGLHAASCVEPPLPAPDELRMDTIAEPAELPAPQAAAMQVLETRSEPEMDVRPAEQAVVRREPDNYVIPVEHWWEPAQPEAMAEVTEAVAPSEPVYANLIEFPRELVATRKARPRLAEGPYAAAEEAEGQLSIFEVDPATLPTDAGGTEKMAEPQTFAWTDIQLDAQPLEDFDLESEPEAATAELELASLSRRLLAAVVDGTLITGAFLAAAAVAAANMDRLPAIRLIEIGAPVALAVTGLLYMALFSMLAEATPGMKYARIGLCTFDDQSPTRAQRCGRLGALLLSVLPLGLGAAWAIFDEDHLSWHDRLSRTYQRKCIA
jgi:uncharacterized RDD family membrane protein YckC